MLIAGHDTSTALLAWALYLLGRHPSILARVQVEVKDVLGQAPPTSETIVGLTCLDQVVKETLRLYPPIHLGMRTAATDLEFQGYGIPAGTRVLYSIYLSQRDPRYWPEPHRFAPDRFTAAQNRARPHYVYLPFGGGPRNCIGFTFAQVEARVVLARIFQRVDLKLLQHNIRVHMGATLEPRPGVLMKVVKNGFLK
jgi:cytochrome P450